MCRHSYITPSWITLNWKVVKAVGGGGGEEISSRIHKLPFPGIFIIKSESKIDLDEHQTQYDIQKIYNYILNNIGFQLWQYNDWMLTSREIELCYKKYCIRYIKENKGNFGETGNHILNWVPNENMFSFLKIPAASLSQ
jgi:hypothetical protein